MLRGERVRLRRVEEADHLDIQRWQNEPEVARWMNYDKAISLEDIHESEARAVEEGHPFIIEVDGRGIGRIGLNNIRPRDRLASLYIFVGEPDVWGQGYGLDALFAVLDYGFNTLNLRMIELWMLDGNERAGRMYKSAGFTQDARLQKRNFLDGDYVDSVILSIDRDGFERARAAHADR